MGGDGWGSGGSAAPWASMESAAVPGRRGGKRGVCVCVGGDVVVLPYRIRQPPESFLVCVFIMASLNCRRESVTPADCKHRSA